MLAKFQLKNFKAHRDSDLTMGRITVLIGPQGSGKSSIIHGLWLLRESSGSEALPLSGPFESLEFVDIIHQRRDRLLLSFGIEMECAGAPAFLSEAGTYHVTYDIRFDNRGFREHSALYRIGSYVWEFRTPKVGTWNVPDPFQLEGRAQVRFYGSTYSLLPFTYKLDGRDYPLHRGVNDLRLAVSDFFKQLQIVPENRIVSRSIYPVTDVSDSGPRSVDQVISKAAREWQIGSETSEYVNRLFGRRMQFLGLKEGIQIEVAGDLPGPYPVMCEGGGLRSLIWPLAAIASAQPGSLVAIEEPESHVHPRALGALSDLLVDATREKDLQLLLTCHNEHLLLALLSAVANGNLNESDLKIYFCEESGGVANVRALEVDSMGQLDGGLPGFFETSLDELEAFVSGLKRNQSEA